MCPKVMAFVGYNHRHEFLDEKEKIISLQLSDDKPDIVCDVSTCFQDGPLWKIVVGETNFIPATVPIYSTINKNKKLDCAAIFKDIVECARGGVKIITIHPTPDSHLVQLASSRIVPTTSRGGKIIINNGLTNSKLGNIYSDILGDIASLAIEFNLSISIGSVFRGANIVDAMDEANIAEIQKQIELANYFKDRDVTVFIEGPGHIPIFKIESFASLLCNSGFKVMPLGPILADQVFDSDHIAASIGAVVLGKYLDIANIAAVSRVEHMGGVPTFEDLKQAIKSAKLAAHIINHIQTNNIEDDKEVIMKRFANKSCTISGNCGRCSSLCPLL